MSKMTEVIEAFIEEETHVSVYKPDTGYVLGLVTRLDDDVVSIRPDDGRPYIVHYSQFSVERD